MQGRGFLFIEGLHIMQTEPVIIGELSAAVTVPQNDLILG